MRLSDEVKCLNCGSIVHALKISKRNDEVLKQLEMFPRFYALMECDSCETGYWQELLEDGTLVPISDYKELT